MVIRRVAKTIVFVASLVPAALLVRGMLAGTLGVNPAETVQLGTGRWALKFLLLSLAITPIRRLTGWNIVIHYRRMLGLFAFFYATLHLLSYWSFDLGFAVGDFAADILKRPFIALGFAAFVCSCRSRSRPPKAGSAGSASGGRGCIVSCTLPRFSRRSTSR